MDVKTLSRNYDRLIELAATQHGFLTTADVDDLEVPQTYLRKLVLADRAEQRYRGLYRLTAIPVTPLDEFHEAVLWAGDGAAVGGEAALDLWNLADVNPRWIDVMVPHGRRLRRKANRKYRVRHGNLKGSDVDFVDGVPVVAPIIAIDQAIADGLETGLVNQAMNAARRRELMSDLDEAYARIALAQRQKKKNVRQESA